ncbi:Crp/Fnr family transcriptional regulator [Pontixanthobacter aquaemixtae]|uniref:Helix-turn-helix domain-containing protein n=1 Tax=Pontixanthobacter aquaemixtae TaxID=1958940 RepID=A0A844ZQF5_9SPHN|nr:Crp/Fnr family transcriptional regulator [Pontixanthobacter aquaemixtae]MXO89266.1 helix-turn-helix domain-containing protein [Pontixanthobacter aquaemixtae]
MESHDLKRRFADFVLGSATDPVTLDQFAAIARVVRADRTERVRLDESGPQFVFIGEGATKLVAHASSGREQIVAFHFHDDLVSIPPRGPHSYYLCALESCTMLVFNADKFMALAVTEPGILNETCQRTLAALWRSREKAIQLGRKTARERLANFLLQMAERKVPHRTGSCEVHLPMSRRDIADSLGLTIETVSRQIGELKTEGLIGTAGRSTVHLHDLQSLRTRADLLPDPG